MDLLKTGEDSYTKQADSCVVKKVRDSLSSFSKLLLAKSIHSFILNKTIPLLRRKTVEHYSQRYYWTHIKLI